MKEIQSIIRMNRWKIIIVSFSLLLSVIRFPNFDTMLWAASDTNYQCIMNAKAMTESNRHVGKILPTLTFEEETDYGVEYSSGCLDKDELRFFYISFPEFPFWILSLYFSLFRIPIGLEGLYIFCNILLAISCWLVMTLFEKMLDNNDISINIPLFAGLCYICSTEILHSEGLLYWGQSWYMIFFPLICIFYMEYRNHKSTKNLIKLLLSTMLILQTEWTGYFVVVALILLFLFQGIKERTKIYFKIVAALIIEIIMSLSWFVLLRIYAVGWQKFIDSMTQRFLGRTRVADYTLEDKLHVLFQSFGVLFVIITVLLLLNLVLVRRKITQIKGVAPVLFLFTFPLLENFIFVNHYITYMMDRMKWVFLLILVIICLLNNIKQKELILLTNLIIISALFCNVILYVFVPNTYKWYDSRLKRSEIISDYVKEYAQDCVIGQHGNGSVWGYSKMLFNQGIRRSASIHSLDEVARIYSRNKSVLLFGEDLSYTQYYYSSAVIHDINKDEYEIIGTLPSQYQGDVINSNEYLKYANRIDFYVDSFDNKADSLCFLESQDSYEREEAIGKLIQKYYLSENTIIYKATARYVPEIIQVANLSMNEWILGTSTDRLIIPKSDSTIDLLNRASALQVDNEPVQILGYSYDPGYLFVTVKLGEGQNINQFAYPNAIKVILR